MSDCEHDFDSVVAAYGGCEHHCPKCGDRECEVLSVEIIALKNQLKVYHEERQELRRILHIDRKQQGVTAVTDFDLQPSLADAARLMCHWREAGKSFLKMWNEHMTMNRFIGSMTALHDCEAEESK